MKTRLRIAVLPVLFVATAFARTPPIAPPPSGKLYHGCYWGGIGTDNHDPTEHDVRPADVTAYEQAIGAQTTWVYFSNNWFESRKFPLETCRWVRDLGKIPYIRLMLRSDVDQQHFEKEFTLTKIIAGDFDPDLRTWARAAKEFGTPILVEWGTEPNGDWFSWNGKWNGGAKEGPKRYQAAYRHIVDIMRSEAADNLQWVWHVNWLDEPEQEWNAFENYFPGADYCDWLGLSAYGPTTPATRDATESFRFKLRDAYPRLTKLAPDKPIIIAEFGCDLHNPGVDAAEWAKLALEDLLSRKYPAIIGFCWWNEAWQNDENKKHDTDMIVLHDRELTRVFRDEFGRYADRIESRAVIGKTK